MLLDYTLFLSGTLASLLVALLLDAILGDPDWIWRWIPHPVVWIGKLIGLLDKILNLKRNNAFNFVLGLVVTLLLVALGIAGGIGLRWISEQTLASAAAAILFVAILLAQKSLYSHVNRVADALKDPDIDVARQTVAMIVGRDPKQLDKAGISRAAIESCAENLSDGVVAPAFWFAVAGFPGLLVYKAINTADSMIGHKNERYHAFGWSAARLDDVLNLIPARITGVLFAICAPVVRGSVFRTLGGMIREAGWHRSPNAGWPEAATAYALGISLAGPRRYGTQQVDAPFFNEKGRKDAGKRDIRRVLNLMIAVLVLHWAIYLGLYAALA